MNAELKKPKKCDLVFAKSQIPVRVAGFCFMKGEK